ncbi:MAG TPA: hypothetical protein VHB54_18720 [Mucilaginibacter sp.]|nr:hypothetical protein [Mucilaginibacter sp.]
MTKVVFKGWRVGMRKIPFTMLLKQGAGLSLKQARTIKTKVLDNEEVVIEIDNIDDVRALVVKANNLGVIAELVE